MSNASQRIDALESKVRRLQIEHRRFLAGALELPPEKLHAEIHAELRSLRSANLKGVEESFRLSNVEATLASYSELFGRLVREQEEGRRAALRQAAGSDGPDARRGVVVGGSAEPEAVETLYRSLQGSGGGPRFDLDTFRTYLERQAEAIRRKTGCRQVVFRIAEEEGKTKLKARPLQSAT